MDLVQERSGCIEVVALCLSEMRWLGLMAWSVPEAHTVLLGCQRTIAFKVAVGALDSLVMRFVGAVVWLLSLVFTWESFCECI